MTDPASTPLTVPGSLPRLPAAKSLFSQHYLQARLPDHAEWSTDPLPVFGTVRQLWEGARVGRKLMNGAYGLTPDEVVSLWRTASPRMAAAGPWAKNGLRTTVVYL